MTGTRDSWEGPDREAHAKEVVLVVDIFFSFLYVFLFCCCRCFCLFVCCNLFRTVLEKSLSVACLFLVFSCLSLFVALFVLF